MKINVFTQKWCRSDYDPSKEKLFIANARYVINRGWLRGTIIHALIAVALSIIAVMILKIPFWNVGALIGISAFAFLFYGINEYWRDNILKAVAVYVFTTAFLIWSYCKISQALQIVIAIVGVLFFGISTFLILRKMFSEKQSFAKLSTEMDEDLNKKDADDFKEWRDRYYTHGDYDEDTYESYSDAHQEDPLVRQAMDLFVGYLTNQTVLKKRYRELAKKYHPDMGGDEELFKRIVTYYEDIKNTVPEK